LLAQRVRRELTSREREVGGSELAAPVADKCSDTVCTFGLEDPDLDARVEFSEAADEVGHGVDREGGQGGDVDRPGTELDNPADRAPRLLGGAQDLAGGTDERLAGRRQPHPAADSVKQLDPKLALEGSERL
jgi:hypothetical protein